MVDGFVHHILNGGNGGREISQVLRRRERNMLKRILIGLMVMIFLLVGIHLSWGGRTDKMDRNPTTGIE